MNHGTKNEDHAMFEFIRWSVTQKRDMYVYECGFRRNKTYDELGVPLGASPDGITKDGIMIEIKCPYSRKPNGNIYDSKTFMYWVQMKFHKELISVILSLKQKFQTFYGNTNPHSRLEKKIYEFTHVSNDVCVKGEGDEITPFAITSGKTLLFNMGGASKKKKKNRTKRVRKSVNKKKRQYKISKRLRKRTRKVKN